MLVMRPTSSMEMHRLSQGCERHYSLPLSPRPYLHSLRRNRALALHRERSPEAPLPAGEEIRLRLGRARRLRIWKSISLREATDPYGLIAVHVDVVERDVVFQQRLNEFACVRGYSAAISVHVSGSDRAGAHLCCAHGSRFSNKSTQLFPF